MQVVITIVLLVISPLVIRGEGSVYISLVRLLLMLSYAMKPDCNFIQVCEQETQNQRSTLHHTDDHL
jgi:hypothetical protein